MLCLKALQVRHLSKLLSVHCVAVKQREQVEIKSSVPTVQRRNRDREMQNICLQKGHGWMFMMPWSRQNKGLKIAEGQKQYTFMLLHFKTSTHNWQTFYNKKLKPEQPNKVLWSPVLLTCAVRICSEHCGTLYGYRPNTKAFMLLGTCNVCTDVRKIITRKR